MTEFDPTLNELVEIQVVFDRENFSGADTPDGKRTHISLHLGKLLGKYAANEEQADHGQADESELMTAIAPDLLVYAAQLTTYAGGNLRSSYNKHSIERGLGILAAEDQTIDDLSRMEGKLNDLLYEGSYETKRRSIYFDLYRPVGMLAVMENASRLYGGDIEIIHSEVAPRLVRSAIRIANLQEASLATAYKKRLEYVAQRNGTGTESAHRAMSK